MRSQRSFPFAGPMPTAMKGQSPSGRLDQVHRDRRSGTQRHERARPWGPLPQQYPPTVPKRDPLPIFSRRRPLFFSGVARIGHLLDSLCSIRNAGVKGSTPFAGSFLTSCLLATYGRPRNRLDACPWSPLLNRVSERPAGNCKTRARRAACFPRRGAGLHGILFRQLKSVFTIGGRPAIWQQRFHGGVGGCGR